MFASQIAAKLLQAQASQQAQQTRLNSEFDRRLQSVENVVQQQPRSTRLDPSAKVFAPRSASAQPQSSDRIPGKTASCVPLNEDSAPSCESIASPMCLGVSGDARSGDALSLPPVTQAQQACESSLQVIAPPQRITALPPSHNKDKRCSFTASMRKRFPRSTQVQAACAAGPSCFQSRDVPSSSSISAGTTLPSPSSASSSSHEHTDAHTRAHTHTHTNRTHRRMHTRTHARTLARM